MIYILLPWLTAPLWCPLAQVRKPACKTPRRILIAEIAGIGDVVCSTAVFKAVRAHYPQAHIALMVDTVVVALAKQDANLDEVIPFAYSAQRGLKGRLNLMRVMRGYDSLICLIPSAAQLSAACWAGLPRRLSVLPDVSATSYQWLAPLMTHTLSHQSNTPFVAPKLFGELFQFCGLLFQFCGEFSQLFALFCQLSGLLFQFIDSWAHTGTDTQRVNAISRL